MTPGQVHKQGWRWFPTALIVIALLGGLIALAQHFGFWLDRQNVKHQGQVGAIQASQSYNITQHSKAYQDAQIQIMNTRLDNIDGAGGLASARASVPTGSGEQDTLRAQELFELRWFCQAAQNIVPGNAAYTSGSPSLQQITQANCLGGAVAANPPLAMNPIPDNGV